MPRVCIFPTDPTMPRVPSRPIRRCRAYIPARSDDAAPGWPKTARTSARRARGCERVCPPGGIGHGTPVGVSVCAPLAESTSQIARWNPAAAARTGIPVDAMVGEPIGKMFVVADVAK
eukprot:748989-Prorocentrum_minimum.AAC.1